ncbi:MAG: NPCBM/NEW2 domain-containing protein [Candidatus Hydrogenedentes bacterium]|nr:NPCBM/NEW2 domain-containing protein [Candidatus Hydrogenedentota bacterium]
MSLLLSLSQLAIAVTPYPTEIDDASRWAAAKFTGVVEAPTLPADCVEVVTNHDPVQLNARHGKPLSIADQQYTRGLYCHAPSELIVHLSKPAARFEAVVGVDSNEQTSGGRGSVVFSVSAGGAERWNSGVMREGMPGVPVAVDLGGAKEFVLAISDAGDGIACDQSDWAEARVTLADGGQILLAELPLVGGGPAPYTPEPFFSFTYGDRPSADFLASWKLERASRALDDARTAHTLTYTDPDTGLKVRCEGVQYQAFPTVEWTLYFENTGTADTPILADIRSCDLQFERADGAEFVLHHHKGDHHDIYSYAPVDTALPADAALDFAPAGGRPSHGAMPYFNLQWSGRGAIIAVGWPGQWAARFERDAGRSVRIRAGQELARLTLHPGEAIRTPLIALQFYQGDPMRAQNVWRRWMMAHNVPRQEGALPQPMVLASSSRAYIEMTQANDQTQIMFIDRFIEEGLHLDYWWMDAGWYPCGGEWPKVGTWEPDPERFPNGFKPVSDHAHEKGIKILVWFEPERVAAGTWLTNNHPEWILGGAGGGLLNLGDPEARAWLTEHVDSLLTEQGIDLYRQDFNMDPLPLWRGHDAENRQGITEIRHVEGYLAYFDELRRRHPAMLIDTCASGGGRLDLETLRRAVPLWRSDYAYVPVGMQCLNYGMFYWLPYFGTGTVACESVGYYGGGFTEVEPYAFWSNVTPSIACGFDMRVKEIDYDALKALFDEWRRLSAYYYGDYYPLTPHQVGNDIWMAWQFNSPETAGGAVQAFRRADSVYESARLPLRALEPDARYRLTEISSAGAAYEATGRELLDRGVLISLPDKPGAAVVLYEKL